MKLWPGALGIDQLLAQHEMAVPHGTTKKDMCHSNHFHQHEQGESRFPSRTKGTNNREKRGGTRAVIIRCGPESFCQWEEQRDQPGVSMGGAKHRSKAARGADEEGAGCGVQWDLGRCKRLKVSKH